MRFHRKKMLRAIELFGTEVAPVVRKEIARRHAAPVPATNPMKFR
jgi:hypothetical protein